MASLLSYAQWMTMAATEYRRLDDLVGSLSAEQFELPTDCPGWDVRAVVSHVAGGAAASGKVTEALRQLRAGRRLMPGADMIEAANAVHVSERRDLTPVELRADLRRAAESGMRRRRRPARRGWMRSRTAAASGRGHGTAVMAQQVPF